MKIGVWILGDQLSPYGSAIAPLPVGSPVILIESLNHGRSRPYHQQKLILVWSAMRHFAMELQQRGYDVTYTEAEDFSTALSNWITIHQITLVRVMTPTDKPFRTLIHSLQLSCPVEQVANNQFLWSSEAFLQWAKSQKRLLMENFYREGRKRFQVLMQPHGQPIGNQWNFDKENRKPPRKADPNFNPPPPLWFPPDSITQTVIEKVNTLDFPVYGDSQQFGWAVTRTQSLAVLENFIEHRLKTFGPYEDAMVTGEDSLWHSLLSPYLNLGLLTPWEVVQRVELEYHTRETIGEQRIALNNIEGMIRQVMGWREYMRGIYEWSDPTYPNQNWFNHHHPLPPFFWDATQTDMNCLHQCLHQTERLGYAHHIQRLMVLSNFALIAGIQPQAIEQWFHSAYVDAYDWVMQTNVIGMGQYADGGVLASKPYAASANYINKMSDYCKACPYDPKSRIGEAACPFNFFYWDFLHRHRQKLSHQGRMSFILKNLDRMDEAELNGIRQQAIRWHQRYNSHSSTMA
ncbi:MAG: cryptochrome/photolyase family protein [Synechococcales bacterium]|nr:cryptochrome/photolyase family protein [Cyanobacteria bacterium REEB444]MEB3124111.1 cryptochrome/photolyase family protein [Synechococcales bacterium]